VETGADQACVTDAFVVLVSFGDTLLSFDLAVFLFEP
jgi:hypothetical protein